MSSASYPSLTLSSGYTVPVLGFGTWRAPPNETRSAVRQAIINGYRHIDCARMYGNENEVGLGIQDAIRELGGSLSRSDIFITSKIWNDQHSEAECRAAVEQTLRELQTEYLDLLLIHWPVSWTKGTREDAHIPLFTTWRVLESLVHSGSVRSIGVSNFNSQEIRQLIENPEIQIFPAMNQVELHPYWNQRELRSELAAISQRVQEIELSRGKSQSNYQLHVTAYCPLGNLQRKEGEPNWDESPLKHPTILSLAQKYSRSAAQIILRWHLQSGWAFLPKSVHEERIRENYQLLDIPQLSADEMELINAIGSEKHMRFVNPEFRDGGKNRIFPN